MKRVQLLELLESSSHALRTASEGAEVVRESSAGDVTPSTARTSALRDIYSVRLRRAPAGVRGLEQLVPALERFLGGTVELYSYRTTEKWATIFVTREAELLGCVVGADRLHLARDSRSGEVGPDFHDISTNERWDVTAPGQRNDHVSRYSPIFGDGAG